MGLLKISLSWLYLRKYYSDGDEKIGIVSWILKTGNDCKHVNKTTLQGVELVWLWLNADKLGVYNLHKSVFEWVQFYHVEWILGGAFAHSCLIVL